MSFGLKKTRVPLLTERALIAAIRGRSGKQPGSRRTLALGIGDDCAILRPRSNEDLVVTTDLSLENVHFRRDWHPAQSVGHRCLARGLSDLAAMGARPEAAFLSLALPASLAGGQPSSWLHRFLTGFLALAKLHQVPLAGGDTARSPAGSDDGLVSADIVLIGSVPRGKALLRSAARVGDIVCVTGSLGGSAAELEALRKRPTAFRRVRTAGHPHLYPEPRLEVGRLLLRRGLATAAIDLSDGLSTDLTHLCEESGLSAEIHAEALPLATGATLKQALHGGEDYELLFTVPAGKGIPGELGGVAIHAIGRMKAKRKGSPIELQHAGKSTILANEGWEHFR